MYRPSNGQFPVVGRVGRYDRGITVTKTNLRNIEGVKEEQRGSILMEFQRYGK